MNAEVKTFVEALVSNALTTQLIVACLVSLIGAGVGAYFGAYFKRKAQRTADKEDFAGLLHDEVTKTFETESVKAAITDATNQSLERLRTDLQERIAFVTFRRELIARHHESLMSALRDFSTAAQNIKYEWPRGEIPKVRPQIIANLKSIGIRCAMLRSLGSVDPSLVKGFDAALENAGKALEDALATKVQYSIEFQEEHRGAPRPTLEVLTRNYGQLDTAAAELATSVLSVVRNTIVPGGNS